MTGNEPGASEIEDGTEAVDRGRHDDKEQPRYRRLRADSFRDMSQNFKCDVMSAADIGAASGRRTKVVGFDSPRVALESL